MNKKLQIAIPIICVLLTMGGIKGYDYGKEKINDYLGKERAKYYNFGVIRITNQYYEQAKTGELKLRPFLLNEDGNPIIENGKYKQGELIKVEKINQEKDE